MKTSKKVSIGVSSAALLAMLVTGCGTGTNTAPTSAGAAKSPSTTTDTASSSGSDRVAIMVGGLEKIIYLPYMLTEKLGYFKDEGLTVTLVNESAGQDAEVALLSGQVDGAGGFYDHTIDLASKGKKVEAVVTMADVPGEQLMLADKLKDKVKTLKDLKGLTIGVTGLGSSTNMLASYNVVKGGNKESDYKPLPVGAGQTLIAAMQQGRIDAAVTSEPTASMLKAKHLASTFVDMNSKQGTVEALGGKYASTSLYMTNDYVKAHPAVVQKLANAFVKTLKWMNIHTPEEIASKMPEEYYAGDKAMYITALKGQLPMFTPDGKMPQGDPENVLKILSSFKPEVKNVKLDETYTNEFVDKVK
ncbi:ABC transporter substrate-binding protein [Aneurinibacillus sp. Ricciae_BoGa-3]|uniref:ABC transporter substrate-binding protein n=1 Tax=Aneurinibacillus sp. Ricciae_BoGa-3 TaxID=3022697 RepID=UPI00233FDDEC|nr:ABC transporter substrate-binding protein [Aneurinibacillus sp. Ricciae_BoGa-3]WCK54075.1 ABC transporter substrate-binding protein [Aneurinibacillus sp. Ricciae_BoGa-3]